ncbi:MAG: hypothetical protein RLP44_29725 [Aggregatilineales bacterium]
MTTFDTLDTYLTEANATLDDLQALLADLRGYGVVQFDRSVSQFAGTGTYLIPVTLSMCGGVR